MKLCAILNPTIIFDCGVWDKGQLSDRRMLVARSIGVACTQYYLQNKKKLFFFRAHRYPALFHRLCLVQSSPAPAASATQWPV